MPNEINNPLNGNFHDNEELSNSVEMTDESSLDSLEGISSESSTPNIGGRLKNIASNVSSAISSTLSVLSNPMTYIAIATGVGLTVTYTLSETVGKQDFNRVCGVMNAPNLTELPVEEREQATVSYFVNSGWSKEQAGAMTAIMFRNKDFTVFSTNNLDGACDNDCVIAANPLSTTDNSSSNANSGKYIGVMKYYGADARELAQFAKDNDRKWSNADAQLGFFNKKTKDLSAQGALAGFELEAQKDNYVSLLANAMGVEFTLREKNDLVEYAKELATSHTGETVLCEPLGDGSKDNRLGNTAGSTSNADLSGVVALANSIAPERGKTVMTNGGMGGEQANEQYKDAKKIAEAKGGADSGYPGLYASCDRFVATLLKATGVDTEVPWGDVWAMRSYFEKSDKWKKVECREREAGDVITTTASSPPEYSHIALYGGVIDGVPTLFEASYLHFVPHKVNLHECNGLDGQGREVVYWRKK